MTEGDRQLLLRIARGALVAKICGAPIAVHPSTKELARPGGAFVTLNSKGRLRGCIGHIEADEPLGEVVAHCAVAAATADPRFPAVTSSELPEIDIEISVLGLFERVDNVAEIVIGRHGLLIEMGRHRGLLLPQVATEWRWDRTAFLEQTCHKAGLAVGAWKDGAAIWKFEADVFSELLLGSTESGSNVPDDR